MGKLADGDDAVLVEILERFLFGFVFVIEVVGHVGGVGIEEAFDDGGASVFGRDEVFAGDEAVVWGAACFLEFLHGHVDFEGVRLGGDAGVDVGVGGF